MIDYKKENAPAISLKQLCEGAGVSYFTLYNNMKKKPEYSTITDEMTTAILQELERQVKQFKTMVK